MQGNPIEDTLHFLYSMNKITEILENPVWIITFQLLSLFDMPVFQQPRRLRFFLCITNLSDSYRDKQQSISLIAYLLREIYIPPYPTFIKVKFSQSTSSSNSPFKYGSISDSLRIKGTL